MAPKYRNLANDMREEIAVLGVQMIRLCTRSVLDSAAEKGPCFGGIFLDNVAYQMERNADKDGEDPQVTFILGNPSAPTLLWEQWITEQSSNVAYIPPEQVLGTGDKSKANSWAVGCLVAQLLSSGRPLQLRRTWRTSPGVEHFFLSQPQILERLRQFYDGFEKEPGLIVGPEIKVDGVPHACEDFLAHCLDPLPARRWTLDQLRKHPFVNLRISQEKLFEMDEEYFRPLPLVQKFTVNNIRQHPYLASASRYSVLVGKSPDVRTDQQTETPVEIWTFTLLQEAQNRDLYTRAYGKLLGLLTLESSDDDSVRRRADFYGIRVLQQGHQNIVQHYGCRFIPRPNNYSMPEFVVFTEHCAGGNFQQASAFRLPLGIITKWVEEVVRGLDFLHKHGIVHRNINSTFIFFTDCLFKGTIKIGGFHNMRQLSGERTPRREISPRLGEDGRFAAPELVSSAGDVTVGRKCDIWSIGCILLQLLTGHPPLYRGQSGRFIDSEMTVIYHLNHQKRGPEIPDWVPGSVRAFIRRCLQLEQGSRPTAAELLQDLNSLVVEEGDAINYQHQRAGDSLPQDTALYWTQKS